MKSAINKIITRFYSLSFLLIVLHTAVFSQQGNIQLLRGPYLQQVTSNSITIRWRTDSMTTSQVEYGTDLNYGQTANSTSLTTEHIVNITGLDPNTQYYYRIGNHAQVLQGDASNNFVTAPVKGAFTPVRIWATGDFGVGTAQQAAVRDAFAAYSNNTNLWIWLGDNAYSSGTDEQYQDYVFEMYPEQLKSIPLYPAPGNHDYGQTGYLSIHALTTGFPYFSIFTVPQQGEAGGVPSGTPKYYSYDYANIHFISLDSYGAPNHPGSAMYNWLVNDLSQNTQRWTIVYFHHPPYSKGSHDSDREKELIDMRTHIIPLLEIFKTDLVLSGHSHSNERSFLIKGHYGASHTFDSSMKLVPNTNWFNKKVPYDGTIYAICGTSGQYGGGSQGDAPMPCMYFNDFTTNCSMVIDVQGDVLHAKYLASNGVVIDDFSIIKEGPTGHTKHHEASCEISYHSSTRMIHISMYLPEDENVQAGIYNLSGKNIKSFGGVTGKFNKGYHVKSEFFSRNFLTKGIYFVKVLIGDEVFVKKLFIY